jgi:glycosyltransferase involved in cell wall biosynthesis
VIVFDISRLLSRAGRGTPTGIDRVELAYAEHLIGASAPLCFAAVTPWGRLGLLERSAADEYVAAIAAVWREAAASPSRQRGVRRLARRLRFAPLRRAAHALHAQLRAAIDQPVYLLVSHHHLERRRLIARLKRRSSVRFVCLIHDLIPMEFPEYARPGQDLRHRRRIETTASLADAVIVGSTATRDALQPHLDRGGRTPIVLVSPFGVDLPKVPANGPSPPDKPYFVCVGTIEPRKNHLLLLNLWRQLAAELGPQAPRLVLVGHRGWETGNAVEMLDRCAVLRGLVFERSHVPDTEMAHLLKGARALLLPSFAEGFGFPMLEALGLGVPVLCTDLAALRENGGDIPEYLDPLDGHGWRDAVLDYSWEVSPRREAQLSRLAGWKATDWKDHFAAVEALIAQTTALNARAGE